MLIYCFPEGFQINMGDIGSKSITTLDRKIYYENIKIKKITSILKIVKIIYYILFICCIIYLFLNNSTTINMPIKITLIIFFIIFPYIIQIFKYLFSFVQIIIKFIT